MAQPPLEIAARASRAGRIWLVGLIAATLLGGGYSCSSSPPGTPRQLPSGRTVNVVWSGVLGEGEHAWALKYWTHLPITDRAALLDEATELWAQVQSEADASGALRASLWPINLDSHFIHVEGWRPVYVTLHSPDFSFEKDPAGRWTHRALSEHQTLSGQTE